MSLDSEFSQLCGAVGWEDHRRGHRRISWLHVPVQLQPQAPRRRALPLPRVLLGAKRLHHRGNKPPLAPLARKKPATVRDVLLPRWWAWATGGLSYRHRRERRATSLVRAPPILADA